MGYEKSRFVDQSLAEELICGICRNIFETPVSSDCVHNFCLQCVRQSVGYMNTCPACRQRFSSKRRRNDNNLIRVGSYSFQKNVLVANLINKLKIRCSFETFGCEQTVEVGSLNTHENQCPFRLCQICEIPLSPNVDHNCLEIMKTENTDLLSKLKESKKLLEQNSTLIQSLSLFPLTLKTVTTGDQTLDLGELLFECNQYIRLSFVKRLYFRRTLSVILYIDFFSIDEVLYCSESSKPLLVLKLDIHSYKKMLETASQYGLNIKSIGISIDLNLN